MFVCPECGAQQGAQGHCPADGAPLAAIGEDLLLGTTVGAYRVARLLGIGGMGRVYKGVHPTIGSRVAIKVLSRECSDRRDLVERFFAEAKAVNLIRHESIVNVLDLAMLPDGRPYIIMEYLDGAPLSALVDHAVTTRTPIPLGGLARLAAEVLDALGAAHGKGIVHRDLKPDNIFVTPGGRPKVLDFGIAKLSDSAPGTGTATGSLLGTPHYMAPEQAAGKPVDHRADLYAMGVILFECATGHKPFLADSLFDLLRKHVEAPPPSPRQLRPDMPPELEQLILVALAKAPEQRFASAQAMSMALQHATQRLPQEAWAPLTLQSRMTGQPTPSWPSQPPSWAGAGGPAGVAGVAGVGGARGARESVQPPVGQHTTSSGQVTSKQVKPVKSSSKKGLWIALFAIVLVGGGVTAAVMAGGGAGDGTGMSEPDPTSTTAATPTPAPTAAPSTAPAAPAKVAGGPTPATPTPAKPAAVEDPDDKDDKDDDKDDEPSSPAQVVAQVVAEDPAQPSSPTPAGTSGWFTRHAVTPPSRDMKKLDVDQHIAWAIAEAKRTVPDAQLFRIDLENVYPDGHADLTLPGFAYKYGGIDLRFISPSHSKRDPSVPRGVKVERTCALRVDGGPDGFEIRDLSGDCDEVAVPAPKCKLAQVWNKALAKHPDVADAVASIDYRVQGKTPKWWFTIYDDGKSIVSETFADDCK
ncbi:MAG: serine/threonine protein kinase [Myxococcales bacterium]|nr:serine/threonine protein kinase [Myxococcales bacterium]